MKVERWGCLLILIITLGVSAQEALRREVLASADIKIEVTPDAGGRVLSFSLIQGDNFLKIGEAVDSPLLTEVGVNTPFIPYFGHEVWFGPQSHWWVQQSILPERMAQKSAWPPDPFSSLSSNQIVEKTARNLVMKSGVSPVNGLEVEKTFALVMGNSHQVDLWVKATNRRSESVAWDIWFNTRSFPTTQIYVPLDESIQVRRQDWAASVPYIVDDGILSLNLPKDNQSNPIKGKLFIQPSAGWFAAFRQNQLMIVQFPLEPVTAIHPEQGQLEFYLEYYSPDLSKGVLEMEVHSAYKSLKKNQRMIARERWTLLPYSGQNTQDAQRAFLKQVIKDITPLQ